MKRILFRIKLFFMKRRFSEQILLVASFCFIFSGLITITLSFHKEVLEDKYIVSEVTEYKNIELPSLEDGEYKVTKNIDYIGKGTYKITYKTAFKGDKNSILDEDSKVKITEVLGEGYSLEEDYLSVNGTEYEINSNDNNNLFITYKENTIDIELDKNFALDNNTISIKIKLIDRKEKERYITTKDSYFTIIPNILNKYYLKKSNQSYIIPGEGYIILKNK